MLFAYRNDERCSRYQRYEDTSLAYLKEYVQRYACCQFLSKEEEQHYAICSRDGEYLIGDLSVFYSCKDNCFTLGLTVSPDFQGMGYGYELLREVVRQLRIHHSDADLVALIEKGNGPSLSLFRKLNFVEECYADSIESYVYVNYSRRELDAGE